MTTALDARRDADATRAEWLSGVAAGVLTMSDVISDAATIPALRRITLRSLLSAQPGVGRVATERVLSRLRSTLDVDQRLTIDWLIDPRSEGKRLLAWIDTTTPRDHAPWSGYPLAPPPTAAR